VVFGSGPGKAVEQAAKALREKLLDAFGDDAHDVWLNHALRGEPAKADRRTATFAGIRNRHGIDMQVAELGRNLLSGTRPEKLPPGFKTTVKNFLRERCGVTSAKALGKPTPAILRLEEEYVRWGKKHYPRYKTDSLPDLREMIFKMKLFAPLATENDD